VGAYDTWLAELAEAVGVGSGLALVAVGGLGRREVAPYSDLDLVLLHNGRSVPAGLADGLWYPIWDSGVGLDHSVRTADQALSVAKSDLKAMLGLLDIRHLAGDQSLSGGLRERVLELWRATAPKRLDQLRELSRARWDSAGEAAYLLQPNLKDSRGGLRDAHALHGLGLAQLIDFPPPIREANESLLDIRGELHRKTGRNEDVLRHQEQPAVAQALGLDGPDAVLRAVNEAARTISLAVDAAWRRIDLGRRPSRIPRPRRLLAFSPPAAERTPLADGVVAQGGEVVLARDADPSLDPLLVLRVARAAATNDLPLAPFTLERLAKESAPMPLPWPAGALADLLSVLGSGRSGIGVLESLDQVGLLVRLIPEWDAVRFAAQHNPVHRYTVDRHLLETAAQAADLTAQVERPDLLMLAALLHDIGKGRPERDHSELGAELAEPIVTRLGLAEADVATVTALVRHHLLLINTATRRDPDDPRTIRFVLDVVSDSVEMLDLLHMLTIADALATGPAAWSDWRAGLVADLVRRSRSVMSGVPLPRTPPLDDVRRRLAEDGLLAVEFGENTVIVAAPDQLGVLSRTAGVLALHSLDVRSASIRTHAGMAVNAFVVEPRFGTMPDPTVIRGDLARAIDGTLPLAERLAAKERAYDRVGIERRPSRLLWLDDDATDATVLELRADDGIGLLYRVTAALEESGVDIRAARVSSMAGAVVDAFYLTTSDGAAVPEPARAAIESALTS
jgi:[protein-PII] uridylyltransferase